MDRYAHQACCPAAADGAHTFVIYIAYARVPNISHFHSFVDITTFVNQTDLLDEKSPLRPLRVELLDTNKGDWI
jgi:hypothetical protein